MKFIRNSPFAILKDRNNSMTVVLLLHGPRNLLGTREPEVYGLMTLEKINTQVVAAAFKCGVEVRAVQSNYEGDLVDALHEARS